ncbi:Ribose-phosphate pyrophosphokinase [[Mycoplasma] cavipharyngis]|uniref:ribose-phosphate diphosphokinase n=1 Tax=[Mycoplasma] cavipharyngis TaxID=92757 RepID=UPI003704709B
MNNNNNFLIFGLQGCEKLTKLICEQFNVEPAPIEIRRFADGEIYCRPLISVRNKKVILLQSTYHPVNDNLMTLLITIDALKRASVREIDVIIPYYGYARQDRKSSGREPITAKLVANLLTVAGVDRVLLMDIHSNQIQGFFDIPVDTLQATYLLVEVLKQDCDLKNLCIVSPDYGGIKRAREISNILKVPLVIIDKRRPSPNTVQVENVLGDVIDKDCVLVDDIIDTGQTIINASKTLKSKGAKKIMVLATHGLFSYQNGDNFCDACEQNIIDRIYVTNTINNVYNLTIPKLKIVDLSKFYKKLIEIYINDHGSISSVYDEYRKKI